jgi:hypothetical protein
MNKKFLQSVATGVVGLSLVASCAQLGFKKESNTCGAKNGCAASKKESHKCAADKTSKEAKKDAKVEKKSKKSKKVEAAKTEEKKN